MKRTSVMTVAWTLVLGALALAAEPKSASSLDAAKKGIEKANAAYREAVEKKDAAAIRALYTKDSLVLPPDQPIIVGNDAVEEFWKGSFSAGVTDAKLESTDVERSGDTAVETGKYTMTITPGGKEKDSVTAVGKYVVVWKHQKDGSWKIHRDIWNATPNAK